MATILQFPAFSTVEERASRAEPAADRLIAAVGHTASVLLFTGVRYERHAEPLPSDLPPDEPAPLKKGAKKKRTATAHARAK